MALLAEASTASVVKMPEAVASLFDSEAGEECPVKAAVGPEATHQDNFGTGIEANTVNIFYLGIAGPPSTFVLIDIKSGEEHRYVIEQGMHLTYDNSAYTHAIEADADSKRTMLGPVSFPRAPGGTASKR